MVLQLLLQAWKFKTVSSWDGSFVLWFDFCLHVSDLSDISGTLFWYTDQAGGIPVRNCCMSLYTFQKEFNLGKTRPVFFTLRYV